MSSPAYLALEEVVIRYRGQVGEGTLRNWRAMRIGPSFIKIGKAVLYPVSELDRWDKSNLVTCRPSRSLSLAE
ncbi:DNA-binding protein [Bosea sp. Tri-44]|uniref:DNA-binding protein n=1 Tax=Bosea sp. Tri-44 TaxID=1972137 RepID=UPI00100DCE8C|nr:DNA-binding protein [Bosea sp. Tri-44]RXT57705.1 DNA-binding protein [Bosea sp. Tri-44]